MKLEYSNWSDNQLHIRFDYVGERAKEAQQFEDEAKTNVGHMNGSPWVRVIRSHRVVTIELKYSKHKVEEVFGTLSSDDVANQVQAELEQKLR